MTPQTKRGQTGLLPCLASNTNQIEKGSGMAVKFDMGILPQKSTNCEWKSVGELAAKLVKDAAK